MLLLVPMLVLLYSMLVLLVVLLPQLVVLLSKLVLQVLLPLRLVEVPQVPAVHVYVELALLGPEGRVVLCCQAMVR